MSFANGPTRSNMNEDRTEITRKFKLKINKKEVISIEASGDKIIVDKFVDKALIDTFGMFYSLKDPLVKIVENELKPEIKK